MYILEGPVGIGSQFGYWGEWLEEGQYGVVRDGEYVDGGRGPSSVDGHWYRSREVAERVLKRLKEQE